MAKGAPKGNTFNKCKALTDDEHKHLAFKSFCNHVANGKVIQSWSYENGEFMCCYKTMQKYMQENTKDFPTIKFNAALAAGYRKWENVCDDSAEGSNRKANVASLNMLMRNKYGWDKREDKDQPATQSDVKEVMDLIKKQPKVK